MERWFLRVTRAGVAACVAFSSVAWADAPLLVTYPERPPYYYTEAGVPQGTLLLMAWRIFEEAGIPVALSSRPPARVLNEVAQGSPPSCSIGWFKNAERERFGRFSLPFFHDRPLRLVVHSDRLADFRRFPSLSDVLASRPRIGIVAGFSYGLMHEQLLGAARERVDRVEQLMRMVAAGRIDLALVNEMEFEYFKEREGVGRLPLQTLSFPDAPAGNARHVICSRSVPPATLERIDQAIRRLGFDLRPASAGPGPAGNSASASGKARGIPPAPPTASQKTIR